MKFGWINVFGTVIIAVMLIPNLIYARGQHTEHVYRNKFWEIIEQASRFLSIVLLIFPIGISAFGFRTVAHMVIYLSANSLMLLFYIITWGFYFKKQTMRRALSLAIIPTLIFLISGITLGHWALVISSAVFGFSHILITFRSHSKK